MSSHERVGGYVLDAVRASFAGFLAFGPALGVVAVHAVQDGERGHIVRVIVLAPLAHPHHVEWVRLSLAHAANLGEALLALHVFAHHLVELPSVLHPRAVAAGHVVVVHVGQVQNHRQLQLLVRERVLGPQDLDGLLVQRGGVHRATRHVAVPPRNRGGDVGESRSLRPPGLLERPLGAGHVHHGAPALLLPRIVGCRRGGRVGRRVLPVLPVRRLRLRRGLRLLDDFLRLFNLELRIRDLLAPQPQGFVLELHPSLLVAHLTHGVGAVETGGSLGGDILALLGDDPRRLVVLERLGVVGGIPLSRELPLRDVHVGDERGQLDGLSDAHAHLEAPIRGVELLQTDQAVAAQAESLALHHFATRDPFALLGNLLEDLDRPAVLAAPEQLGRGLQVDAQLLKLMHVLPVVVDPLLQRSPGVVRGGRRGDNLGGGGLGLWRGGRRGCLGGGSRGNEGRGGRVEARCRGHGSRGGSRGGGRGGGSRGLRGLALSLVGGPVSLLAIGAAEGDRLAPAAAEELAGRGLGLGGAAVRARLGIGSLLLVPESLEFVGHVGELNLQLLSLGGVGLLGLVGGGERRVGLGERGTAILGSLELIREVLLSLGELLLGVLLLLLELGERRLGRLR
mmetsp:Transcript_6893/g.30140  ORF Transcript_6893/g.30140 Transcript_6893/m.30140 type:complete len:623 (-) Transcript_6893:3906-5774(-)